MQRKFGKSPFILLKMLLFSIFMFISNKYLYKLSYIKVLKFVLF
jgi:hypothetical protein